MLKLPPLVDEQGQVQYRNIPGWIGYRAGSDGTIWSCRRPGNTKTRFAEKWKQRSLCLNLGGRRIAVMCRDKKSSTQDVARLILLTFVGPCPKGKQCCHNNGVVTDNRLENLRWDTSRSNYDDVIKHGTYKGAKNPQARLTDEKVLTIRKRLATGENRRQIAKELGVCYGCIADLAVGKTWKHLPL